MQKRGVISLLTKYDTTVAIRKYDNVSKRKEFIRQWKHYYGKRFSKLYVHISPILDEELLLKELEAETPNEAIMEEISL